jgi:hypothetical protein
MASSLGTTLLYLTGPPYLTATTSTDFTDSFVPFTTVTVSGSATTLYGPQVETLRSFHPGATTKTLTVFTVFSSPTTNTNSTFEPSASTSTTFEPSTSTIIASSGLSSGAKAGIGVGVAVVFLIVTAFVAGCLIVRRRRRKQSPLSELTSTSHEAGYHKPELDANELPQPSNRDPSGGLFEKSGTAANLAQESHTGVQDHRVELHAAPKPRTDGRAELDDHMVPNNGKIT